MSKVEGQIFQPVLRPLVKQLLGLRSEQANKELVAEQTEKLGNVLDVYEAHLSKRKYLARESVSIADLSPLPIAYYYFCLVAQQSHLLPARPHAEGWFHEISSRPSWCTVLQHAAPIFATWTAS